MIYDLKKAMVIKATKDDDEVESDIENSEA
jgi:hypothetical protein